MITEKDYKYRSVIYILADEPKHLSIRTGELLVSDAAGNTVTKYPFPKIGVIFIVGTCTLTSPVLEKLARNSIPFCLMKQNLRSVLWKADIAEANYLLRKKQYILDKDDTSIAKNLIQNKINNQMHLLERVTANELIFEKFCKWEEKINLIENYDELMEIEAHAAKLFFRTWFASLKWTSRKPRIKSDPINVALDIGYTILFNFLEANLRLFGFDLYVGVYHKEWFRRKSLVCDIMEPFRCIIDKETLSSFKAKIFKKTDFKNDNDCYQLEYSHTSKYYKAYVAAIMQYKMQIFRYVRDYYRSFMKQDNPKNYPNFRL